MPAKAKAKAKAKVVTVAKKQDGQGSKVPAKRRRTPLPALSSTLTAAFSHLDGGWHSYIRFVEIASKDESADNPDEPGEMTKLYSHYQSLSKSKRESMTPEALCLDAGINIKTLLGSVMPWIWIYSNTAASVVSAVCNPAVIAKTAKAAMGQGKFAHKDRETFLKITGALPTARGSQTVINNTPVASATAGASSGLPMKLQSAGQAVMELEAADGGDGDNDNDEV